MKIAISNVSQVYSGRQGCACGCRGKHTFALKFEKWSSKRHGYSVKSDVNDRVVKRMVKKVERLADDSVNDFTIEAGHVAVETPTRLYIIYFAVERV
jgi:hypothetical protein